MRLDRFLAQTGLGSRREVQKLLKQGRLSLETQVLTQGSYNLLESQVDQLLLDGESCHLSMAHYFLFHKPVGVITALEDSEACVGDFLPAGLLHCHISPVGRLDKDSSGLLLLCNDGQLNHRLCHPRWHLPKRYEIQYMGEAFGSEDILRFAEGITLDDGPCRPAVLDLSAAQKAENPPWPATIVLWEGRNRQIRRMVQSLGREVLTLHRVAMGPVELETSLAPGQMRKLTAAERQALYEATGLAPLNAFAQRQTRC